MTPFGRVDMGKNGIISIFIGIALFAVAAVMANCVFRGLRFNPWLPVVYGMIIIPSVFPPMIRWAMATMQKHKALLIGLMTLLGFWSICWIAYSVLTLIWIAK